MFGWENSQGVGNGVKNFLGVVIFLIFYFEKNLENLRKLL
jgi:hypothetical protein